MKYIKLFEDFDKNITIEDLHKMTKRQVSSFAWDVTMGGDFSRLSKRDTIKHLTMFFDKDGKLRADEISKKKAFQRWNSKLGWV